MAPAPGHYEVDKVQTSFNGKNGYSLGNSKKLHDINFEKAKS